MLSRPSDSSLWSRRRITTDSPHWTGIVEILILAVIFYAILRFFRGTRGSAILTGFAILFAALIVITRLTNLQILNWLLQKMMLYLALALIGGLVHGLRLNFIEFYQWGLGEEGRPFRPFARKDVER